MNRIKRSVSIITGLLLGIILFSFLATTVKSAPVLPDNNNNRLRERFRERIGQLRSERGIAQRYVNMWFVLSFSLDLGDQDFGAARRIFAKSISKVGLISKGEHIPKGKYKEIFKKLSKDLTRVIGQEKFDKLIEMSDDRSGGRDEWQSDRRRPRRGRMEFGRDGRRLRPNKKVKPKKKPEEL